jgi:hypothetical protein
MMNKKEDKIFNNRYNTGDVNYEVFGKIQVHEKFLPKDVFEEYMSSSLQEELYIIFVKADFYEEYSKNKKVVRGDVSKIYYYFDENLLNTSDIPAIEKFIAIAEFMSIPYEVLYEELAPVYKESLLRELDEKYKIFKKKGIKRLF